MKRKPIDKKLLNNLMRINAKLLQYQSEYKLTDEAEYRLIQTHFQLSDLISQIRDDEIENILFNE